MGSRQRSRLQYNRIVWQLLWSGRAVRRSLPRLGAVCDQLGLELVLQGSRITPRRTTTRSLPKDQPLPRLSCGDEPRRRVHDRSSSHELYWNLGADGSMGATPITSIQQASAGYPFNLMWWNGLDDDGAGVVLGLYARSPTNPPSAAVDKPITFTPNCPYENRISSRTRISAVSWRSCGRAGGGTVFPVIIAEALAVLTLSGGRAREPPRGWSPCG